MCFKKLIIQFNASSLSILLALLLFSSFCLAARQQTQPELEPFLAEKIVCIIQETDGKSSGVGTPLSSMKFIVNTKAGEMIRSTLQKHKPAADGTTPLPEMELVWHQENSQKFVSQTHSSLNLDFSQFKWLGENTRTKSRIIAKGKKRIKSKSLVTVQTYYYTKQAVFNNSRLDLRCRFDVAL